MQASKQDNYTRIIKEMEIKLIPRGDVTKTANGWRMEIPAGTRETYRLSQLDDYHSPPRNRFPHTPPLTFRLRARVSTAELSGTWGFGLWNDPFGLSLGFGGKAGRMPTLPQATWFFYGSKKNYLSFRDDLPANGFFAGTFRSPAIPSPLLAAVGLTLPLFAIRHLSRWIRRLTSKIILQSGTPVHVDVTQWHVFTIEWRTDRCSFIVDGQSLLETPISPRNPLGMVIWIDNQYAEWDPEGHVGFGTQENPDAYLEVGDLTVDHRI